MVYPMDSLMTIDQAAAYLGVKRHRLTSPRARERAGIPTLTLVRQGAVPPRGSRRLARQPPEQPQ